MEWVSLSASLGSPTMNIFSPVQPRRVATKAPAYSARTASTKKRVPLGEMQRNAINGEDKAVLMKKVRAQPTAPLAASG